MVKRQIALETGEKVCPACGGAIKAGPSARRRRVQCPKCREVVFIEGANANESETSSPAPQTAAAAAEATNRMDLLEARVEALEATLRDAMAATRLAPAGAPQRKLLWVTTTPGHPPEFSPEQDRALLYNLVGVRSQAITIRTPAGDPVARARAEWFKAVFERAGWTVCGPEEVAPHTTVSGLRLAVPELPVGKEAAATYLALKAAGFEPIPVLDSESPSRSEDGTIAISLTLPPGKAA